jgi:hypothetical protein
MKHQRRRGARARSGLGPRGKQTNTGWLVAAAAVGLGYLFTRELRYGGSGTGHVVLGGINPNNTQFLWHTNKPRIDRCKSLRQSGERAGYRHCD